MFFAPRRHTDGNSRTTRSETNPVLRVRWGSVEWLVLRIVIFYILTMPRQSNKAKPVWKIGETVGDSNHFLQLKLLQFFSSPSIRKQEG